MDKPFQKDLSHLTWDEVYRRQALRAGLVGDWLDSLDIEAGDRVLEIGAGPGYVSFILADRVGPSGIVYAVDRSAEALAHLERRQRARAGVPIRRIVADASMLDGAGLEPDSALITMVLHHADDPAGIIRNVARLLPPGARIVIGEFHPEGPCDSGPPRDHRLMPETVEAWCATTGLSVASIRRQTPEHYMLTAEKSSRAV